MSENAQRESFASMFSRVVAHWSSIVKFTFLFALIVLVLCGGFFLVTRAIRPLASSATVTVTPKGAYIIEMGGKRTVQYLFSASSMWESSGIEVSEDDRVRFSVSGRAILAIHHLVQSAEKDTIPYFHWIGPEGNQESTQGKFYRGADRHRQPARIAKDAPQGALLMQIVPAGEIAKDRPDSEYLYVVGDGREEPYRMRHSGTLYFALNEIPLNDSLRHIYIVPDSVDSVYYDLHPHQDTAWKRITRWEYWNLWFDDNVGFFLITAEIF